MSVIIESCDGKRLSGSVSSVYVLPGEHIIEMSYHTAGVSYSADTSFMKFTAEAGHIYAVDWEQSKTSPGRYNAFITDTGTGKLVSTYMLKPGSEQERFQVVEKSLREHPRNANFWVEKGDLLVKMRRYNEALPALETALSLDSNQGGGFWNIKSFVLHQLGRDEEALADVEKAVKLRGNESDVRGLNMIKKIVEDKKKSSNP
jgi:tetratricopeptide (TPR) repeat protein